MTLYYTHVEELARLFEQPHFLRFHNAVNSGRTRIYFGKWFKNDVLRPL